MTLGEKSTVIKMISAEIMVCTINKLIDPVVIPIFHPTIGAPKTLAMKMAKSTSAMLFPSDKVAIKLASLL